MKKPQNGLGLTNSTEQLKMQFSQLINLKEKEKYNVSQRIFR